MRAGGDRLREPVVKPDVAVASPRTGEAQHVRGTAQLHQGLLDEAAASFGEALRLNPALAAAWSGLARVHAERGDLEASEQACREAIALNPSQAEAYWRLATILKGRLSDDELTAIEELTSVPALSTDNRALLCFALAAVMEARGRFDRAAARLIEAHAFHSAAKAAQPGL